MNRTKFQTTALLTGTATLALLSAACYVSTESSGSVERDSRTVDLKGAKSVDVQVDMGAGECSSLPPSLKPIEFYRRLTEVMNTHG